VRNSICVSLEGKFLSAFRSLIGVCVPIVGLFETAEAGRIKEEDLTPLQVRVFNMSQQHEGLPMYSASAEIRLTVEQAESASAEVFRETYESVSKFVEDMMLGDNCVSLSTDDVYVDGLQAVGGDADFDISGGEWFAVWNLTVTGRLKTTEE